MAEPLKNRYSKEFFTSFMEECKLVYPNFDSKAFIKAIFNSHWEEKELKERMRHISQTLRLFLPDDFTEALNIVVGISNNLYKKKSDQAFEYMFLPDFVEVFGREYFDISMSALEQITQFTSCEFAIRPFLIEHPEKGMERMLNWSNHKHKNVRRFASEGCRPRLPWAMALPFLKENPAAILPILENLKRDESEFVRKSVANNINDISKDHPELVIDLVKRWKGNHKHTDWITKHGSRTLLKAGNREIMELFGFGSLDYLDVQNLKIESKEIGIGDDLVFSFSLKNTSEEELLVRTEYAVYYQKANGTLSKKVYKISERNFPENSESQIDRKQSFKQISTRKFHPGLHQLAIILNGKEFPKLDFTLK
jgi:3-methyladenine DNA glycosylase AlkC